MFGNCEQLVLLELAKLSRASFKDLVWVRGMRLADKLASVLVIPDLVQA